VRVKALFILTLALTALLSACAAPTATPEPTPAPSEGAPGPTLFEVAWKDPAPFLVGLVDSQAESLDALPAATVYHLDLDLSDDLTVVHGIEEILYTNTEAAPLDQIALHLFPNLLGGEMEVESVRLNGAVVTPDDGEAGGWMMVPLGSGLAPGKSVVLHIDFSVRVPQELELNYGVLASTSGVLAYAHGYPMVAVYDDEGWNVGIPAPYGDLTYSDAALFLVRVRAPDRIVVCASGSEIERSQADGRLVVTYALAPARDFYLAASGEYEVLTQAAGPTTIRTCAPADMQTAARRVLDVAARSLEFFSRIYAPYPYTELDIVATPNLALGIEYPGAFALNQRLLTPEEDFQSAPESVLLESVVAHETAHEWFYNLVGNDQLDDPWLDEALAQYATLQYYEEAYGSQGAEGMLDSFYGRWERVDREPIPIGLPVAEYAEGAYGAIVYGRGPLFFVALKEAMGAGPFDAFLGDYTANYSWELATPEELKALAESQCGCDLTPLFKQWVYAK
jgi:aminopeptidase N